MHPASIRLDGGREEGFAIHWDTPTHKGRTRSLGLTRECAEGKEMTGIV